MTAYNSLKVKTIQEYFRTMEDFYIINDLIPLFVKSNDINNSPKIVILNYKTQRLELSKFCVDDFTNKASDPVLYTPELADYIDIFSHMGIVRTLIEIDANSGELAKIIKIIKDC